MKDRSEENVIELEDVAFRTGTATAEALRLRVSSKLYRLIHHNGEHIRPFGCSRRGDSDENESLHKANKSAHAATNEQTRKRAR